MKNKKLIISVSSLILVIGFILASYFYKQAQQDNASKLNKSEQTTFVRSHSPILGPKDAKVTLVEFLDPECESCRRFYPIVKKILKDYPNDVRLVVRYVAFHANSKLAIAVLEGAKEQNLYWETLEMVFRSQPAWASHHDPKPEKLWEYLKMIDKMDTAKLRVDVQAPKIQEVIKQDRADADTLGVRQTPTFFVNGQKLQRFGEAPLRELILKEINK